MPFGFHLTMDTLPSGDLLLRPTTLLNAVSWIWRPSFERQRDFNPPEQRAAQRTLPASPTSTVASVSLRLIHSVDILGPFSADPDGGGSPRCHDASVSVHAVLLDPAGFSGDHRLLSAAYCCLPDFRPCRHPDVRVTRLNRFTCVTAWTSLCLRLTHVVAFMSPRLDSRWGGSSPFRGGNLTR
jgi:hypothetical protein